MFLICVGKTSIKDIKDNLKLTNDNWFKNVTVVDRFWIIFDVFFMLCSPHDKDRTRHMV